MVIWMSKTVYFEDKYGVDIKKFQTTAQIDEFIEEKKGRKMSLVSVGQGVVKKRGAVLRYAAHNIKELFEKSLDKAIKKQK